MDKKKFIKNRPFDPTDSLQMQDWIEAGLKLNAKALFTSGVISGLGVTSASGLTVNIQPGIAFDINHETIEVKAMFNKALDASSSSTSSRYDAISLKAKKITTDNIDTGNIYGRGSSWTISQNILDSYDIIVRKGANNTSPVAPAVPSDEVHIANVLIRPSATSIIASDIEDKRVSSRLAKDILDLGAIPAPTANQYWWDGKWALNALNSDLVGLNSLVFSDPLDSAEGFWYPKTGKAGSILKADYDNFGVLDGIMFFNGSPIFDDGSPRNVKTITIYVHPSGNDSTGNGSSNYPYKTIQKAVDMIPNVHINDYIVKCAPGSYAENVKLKGLIGGTINIEYNGNAPSSKDGPTGFNLLSILAEDCMCYIRIRDCDFYNSQTIPGDVVRFTRCSYGAVDNCRFDSDTKANSIFSVLYDASKGNIYNSYFTGQYGCVRAQSASQVIISNSNGYSSTNSYSFSSSSSIIHKASGGDTPSGAEVKQSGGQIF